MRQRSLSDAQRRAFLDALGNIMGFEAACVLAGVEPGAVVAERVRDPRFARAWDQHLDACISQLETILLEKATRAVRDSFPSTDTRDKWLVGLVQWLLESRRPTAARAAAAKAQSALPEAAPAQGRVQGGPDDAERVSRLIASAAARLADAEAQLARDGVDSS